jgi:CheY-like chemotaxis protein
MMIDEAAIFKARVLIVDDQESNVTLLEQALRETGYTCVASTTNPLEVCDLHRKNRYDLILLDLQMPGMDGFQVMEALSAEEADDYLSVLVITAQPDHKMRALRSGAKDFITKPFDILEVRTRIRNMLEVRLLYGKLADYNRELEETVAKRTAELRESRARFRGLAELACDWYWEQDENGEFTQTSGPVLEMLGVRAAKGSPGPADAQGWDEPERAKLQAIIDNRQPFLDFELSRVGLDGSRKRFRVSGQPMFSATARFIGYRGIGVETTFQEPSRVPA